MATKVHMEALSPTMEEGQVVKWLKDEGDEVTNGDVLAEIETDKATMELTARGAGILRKVVVGEGGTAPVGTVIAVIGEEDEDISELLRDATAGDAGDEEPEAAGPARKDEEAEEEEEESGRDTTPAAAEAGEEGGRIKASPLARRLAEEAGIDLAAVRGSGPAGRIVKRDVEEAKEKGVAAPAGAPSWAPPEVPGEEYEEVQVSQMRKTIAKRLVESIGPVPHFFLTVEADMGRVMAARKRVNAMLAESERKVSVNDFVLKATATALRQHPAVNAAWHGDVIRRYRVVHLGVAVAVEDGLITPVIRHADRKGIAHISEELKELAGRAREKRLQPDEYTGATFSVSNLGMFGIQEFTAVINPPEAGILAVGRAEEIPVVEEGEVRVRPRMKMTMSCDHRVIDGATGARFLQTLKAMLEEPAAILV
ncbi:MAG: pyruvate dehydrogenase complex dihydrolipoamide acetyltransferase [Gemmatimonadota bacterium]|jgi:pyruvate dehydrogenase E2 component (dihydrolipoamide acetyltransferase)